jgi:hypothetical protein
MSRYCGWIQRVWKILYRYVWIRGFGRYKDTSIRRYMEFWIQSMLRIQRLLDTGHDEKYIYLISEVIDKEIYGKESAEI